MRHVTCDTTRMQRIAEPRASPIDGLRRHGRIENNHSPSRSSSKRNRRKPGYTGRTGKL